MRVFRFLSFHSNVNRHEHLNILHKIHYPPATIFSSVIMDTPSPHHVHMEDLPCAAALAPFFPLLSPPHSSSPPPPTPRPHPAPTRSSPRPAPPPPLTTKTSCSSSAPPG